MSTSTRAKPTLVKSLRGWDGVVWRVYHVSYKLRPDLLTFDGKECEGKVYFDGRYKNKIFINTDIPQKEWFSVLHHELMHVAMHDVGLDGVIEESIVNETSARIAHMLEQLKI